MKNLFAVVLCLTGVSLSALAAFNGPKGATDMVVTVEEAKALNDEAYVTIQGNIIQKIGNEKYLFQDKTGTVEVEIDDEDWHGVDVTEEDTVILQGEVDKGWTSFEIEVDTVTKAPTASAQ